MSALRELWWALPRLGRAGDGRAVGVLSVWIWWERFLNSRWHLQLVRPDGALRYRTTKHRGATVTLKDGTIVSAGDPLIELHLDNSGLMRTSTHATWNTWDTMEQLDADLLALADQVAAGKFGEVRALHAVTLFTAPGVRFGFEPHRVPHTIGWSLRRYFLIGLIPIYHHDGWREFDRMRRGRWPAELWMSVSTLRQRRSTVRA